MSERQAAVLLDALKSASEARRDCAEVERRLLAELWSLGVRDRPIADALGCTYDAARMRRERTIGKERVVLKDRGVEGSWT